MHATLDIAARLHRVERGAGRELLRHRRQRDQPDRGSGETDDLHAKLPSTGAARYRTSLVVASKLHLETALTPDGWRDDVVIRIERGMIVGIEAPGHGPAERI